MSFLRHLGIASIIVAGSTISGLAETPVAEAEFTCDDNKSIKAVFYEQKVELTLSDDRAVELPQTRSASGARYSTADDSIVFWNKGNTAFITEGDDDKETFSNCVTAAK